MRTTLTLDPDVVALLKRIRRQQKGTFKATVNEALRRGLRQMAPGPAKRTPFRVRPLDLGACLLPHLECVGEALEIAEGEWHR